MARGQADGAERVRGGHAAQQSRPCHHGGQFLAGAGGGSISATGKDIAGQIIDFIAANAKDGQTKTKGQVLG